MKSEFTVKTPLSPNLRNQLERAIVNAREVAEVGALAALESLAVHERAPYRHMSHEERALRNRLRAHGRQLGDRRHAGTGGQEIDHLVHECAYEHWHSMLFARFLAENDLLIEPNTGVAVTLEECEELAQEEGLDRWALATRYAHRMLPQVFRPNHPAFEIQLAREHRLKLEQLAEELPTAVFDATDSLGWVYQFWQSRKKAEVNDSEQKIGAEQLPAVTQLFTEPYMVRFLLDNSLGAWWAARRLSASDLEAAASEAELRRTAALPGVPLDYLRFVPCASTNEPARWRPAASTFDAWPEDLGELRVLDPCCGSGHFLVAAFSMLVPMRMEREGLATRDAVDAVLRDNLHGLEIDPRCVALAAFALALIAWGWPGSGGYRPLPELNLACSGLAPNATRKEWRTLSEQAAAVGGMPPARDLFGVEETLLSAPLRGSLDHLHDLFRQAPLLGSLIDPRALKADMFRGDYESVRELFAAVLDQERAADDEQTERAVAARGMARAAELLAGCYHLVITNVPYLARRKHGEPLRAFCQQHYRAAKNDLATVFLERCLSLCEEGGAASLVLPQNWLFLTSYRKLREKLLKTETWHLLARLGPGAFETISGEVVKAILLTLSHGSPAGKPEELDEWAGRLVEQAMAERGGKEISDPADFFNVEMGIHDALANLRKQVMQRFQEDAARTSPPQPDDAAAIGTMYGLNVSALPSARQKSSELSSAAITTYSQREFLQSRQMVISLERPASGPLMADMADYGKGSTTGDALRFLAYFWEFSTIGPRHVKWLNSPRDHPWSGRMQVCKVPLNADELNEQNGCWIRGQRVFGRGGVAVNKMQKLEPFLYAGEVFDDNVCPVVPKDTDTIPAVWSYVKSANYNRDVRSVDQALKVTAGTLTSVPFDREHWAGVAQEEYPNGLPRPYSDDPTQWIFHGHPCGSVIWDETTKGTIHDHIRSDSGVLHVAVARLLGYRWPAERDSAMELADEQREWVRRCAALHSCADEDGIVCLPSVRGEPPAAERLLRLLTAAFGESWTDATLGRLLSSAESPDLEQWLRDRFFEQHCKMFRHRPFLWHIWDGRRDGFHALVNYHKLADDGGKGRRLLESLTYSYLGDWITRQRDGVERGEGGAEDRLPAAVELQRYLQAILEGEQPYDIFVRWKPLAEQPIGWEPDINDGVRLNIRPFMAVDIAGGKKGAGLLRAKPNIHWRKDRGKELLTRNQKSRPSWIQDDSWDPDDDRELRPHEDYPWFWRNDKFTGDRMNDVHLTVAVKLAHRRQPVAAEVSTSSGQSLTPHLGTPDAG